MKKIKIQHFGQIIFFAFMILRAGFANAKYDCELSFESSDNPKIQQIQAIYPKEDIQTALDNLKYYCCEKNLIAQAECPAKDANWQFVQKVYYAQSPRLMDHLIDVGFRKLDGDSAVQYSTATLDDKWVWRRKLIRDSAEAVNGVSPNVILTNYKNYRDSDLQTIPTHNINNIVNNRWNWWLANRYIATCDIAGFVQDRMYNYNNSRANKDVVNCKKLAWQVIDDEMNYMKYVMIQQWANFLASNIRTYTSDYFVNSKLREMIENFSKMQSNFLMINQKVQEWTQICTQ